MSAVSRWNWIRPLRLASGLLATAALICAIPGRAADVSLARADAQLIKSFLPRADLDITEDTASEPAWDRPECPERRTFEVWQKQLHYAKYSVWLCHSGVLGIDGWDTTVEESLRNLGHGDPNQTVEAKEAEGWTFAIGSRRGSTLVAVTVGSGGPKSAVHYLAVAAIRSLDESLNLAVATDDLQLHAADEHPTVIQALRRVEEILRAVDALTSVEER